ncbi:sensor histidine kinase [Bosea sp. (in: a-proteobacteria)]|jgi:two-component system sensor histidine kinase ChvG|uniref:sensor histidine kinase n=1 Tax=Bosea sp. (in: a-proteobacteria) TaxID=1871050 RepID=UPI002733E0FE|nr:sensor histidine kinase [Bosea sp. (in: a-proteobacteria)]MDP3407537.1 sensor histidine kinase [Bosea sp. (in: a-proteobacteria)]
MATINDERRAEDRKRERAPTLRQRLRGLTRRSLRAVSSGAASSLTRRIVVLNLGGLVALLVGFLYLNQFRESLIESRVQSLLTQGEIIAGAIAASATVETDAITIDPDKLLQLQAGESAGIAEDPLDFSINPEKVAPLLRRLVTPTKTRARIYDRDGLLTLDSRSLYSRGDVLRLDLPRVGEPDEAPLLERTWNLLRNRLGRPDVPAYDDFENANGRSYPEVARALSGSPASIVRVNTRGQTIVSVAVPVQRFRAVKGALLLSTQGGDIDAVIVSERYAIFRVFAISAGVMIVLSVLLAGTIAEPIRKLADAAQRVRRGVKSREQIPDFGNRHDEIGHLSGSLREMTKALYSRIEAIESFAADVAHELKNPLTSLRSAVETLPRAKNDESRGRLMAVIQHDVRRLDRLISDISDASRLDAELARNDSGPVDLAQVLEAVVSVQNETRREGQPRIELVSERRRPGGRDGFIVLGHDSRLGQVLVNLIDNARSFSPPDKPVRVLLTRVADQVLITVEDEGPGIESHALERVFERFYTDRPHDGFGQNSGLGLSISRQIVEAHRGTIRAENRLGPAGPDGEQPRLGARFIVSLPALQQTA